MSLSYDTSGSWDSEFTWDGPDSFSFFTPPTVAVIPPFLPTTAGPALRLFRHYANEVRGVNVFLLSNGTYAQDYATPENNNTNIPYPINPYEPGAPFSRVYDFKEQETDSTLDPYVVTIYYGAHANAVDQEEVASLIAAGYGAYLS